VRRQPGNGSGKFDIHAKDMGGWVRVFSDPLATVPENFAAYLSLALTQWFRDRPQLRMRCVVPVQRNGDTVELHAWFDLVQFPDLSGQKAKRVK
jgi:hypothetical protein